MFLTVCWEICWVLGMKMCTLGVVCIVTVQSLSHGWLCDPMNCRLPCPSLSPGICSNTYPLSLWCYLTISSSAALFSFCLQYFRAWGSFQMSRPFPSGGQSNGALASVSVLPMNIQGWWAKWSPASPIVPENGDFIEWYTSLSFHWNEIQLSKQIFLHKKLTDTSIDSIFFFF